MTTFHGHKPPHQAVILAGGRGERMRPLTDTMPKAMIPFSGKPFIVHIIEMLKKQGFSKVLMLTGYLSPVFEEYLGDGSQWGVHIQYSVTAPDDLTCHRLRTAKPLLDDCFILLYCDNYWPMQMDRMWPRFVAADVPAMVTVYRNTDNYTRDSVRVGSDGFIEVFDRSRTTQGLSGVEIGYALLRRSVCDLLPADGDALIEDVVYPELTRRRQLLAFETDHRYYSVGSHQRLPLTEAFFSRSPAVLLDRDGVLNVRQPRGEYVRDWTNFTWLPGALRALQMLRQANYRVIVISNQAGIARGEVTEQALGAIHENMRREAEAAGGAIDAVYYCPHHWNDGCACRKPRAELFFRAQRDHHLDLTETLYIGDDERDGQAAKAAGCPYAMVTPERTLLDIVSNMPGVRSTRQRTSRSRPLSWDGTDNKTMNKPQRVLITGDKGYIGSVLAPVFMEAGYDVTGLDIGYFNECTLVPDTLSPPSIEKDIRDVQPSDLKGYDAIVHLAALSNDPIGNLNQAWTEDINTRASVRLAELAREAGVRRFLFSSSCIMYGMAAADVVNEESPVHPQTEYARSKVECEKAIASLARDGFSPVFLRNGTVYGISPRMRFDTVFNDLVAQAFTTGKVVVYSDGKPWRPVVHVQDVARAFLAVLQAPDELVHNQIYNNGSDRLNHQVITLAEIAARTVPGTKLSVVAQSSADQRTYRTDFGKFARAFPGFEFRWTPESGARELCDSFRRVGLTRSTFTDKRFTRLKWLRHLMDTKRLDESLNWSRIPERQLSSTA